MKEILAELNLPETATVDQAVAAIKKLKEPKPVVETAADKMEKRIRAKIVESGGALNREGAMLAIEHQDAADQKRKAKK